MRDRGEELAAFKRGLEEYIFPAAKKAGLSCEKVDEELYALVAPTFTLKFYCAAGHLYSYSVSISPTYEPVWNAKDELGLVWLAEFLGKEIPRNSRFEHLEEFVQHMANLAKHLSGYIEILKSADASFWERFRDFVQKEIAKRPKPGWWDSIQKLNAAAKGQV